MNIDLTDADRTILCRALRGYTQWCHDRAVECAQKTSRFPASAVGAALNEADAALVLLRLLSPQ